MEIAVLLAVKNGETFLAEAIQSVLDQSYTDFTLYISDDASTDHTPEIIHSFTGHRIRVFTQQKALGQFDNFNFLLQNAKENLVHFWSHDDRMHPHCLQEIIHFHRRFADAGMSYCGSDTIDNQGKTIVKWAYDHTPEILDRKQYARYSLAYGCLAGSISQVTLNRAVTGPHFFFNGLLKHSGDFDLWTRIAENHLVGFIRQSLVSIRRHHLQLSRQFINIYPSIAEDIFLLHTLAPWTKTLQHIQENVIQHLIYVQYFDRAIFLFMHGRFVSACKILKLIARQNQLVQVAKAWFGYRFTTRKKAGIEQQKIRNQIFQSL